MNRRLTLFAALAIGSTPALTPALQAAAGAEDAKILRYQRKLNQMPATRGAPGLVTRYTKRLVRLNPTMAKRYYKLAMLKYARVFIERKAPQLTKMVSHLLAQSSLAPRLQRRLNRQVELIEKQVIQYNEPIPLNEIIPPPDPYSI